MELDDVCRLVGDCEAKVAEFQRRPGDVLGHLLPRELELTMDPATGRTFVIERPAGEGDRG